jgi:hypothetical protein
MTRDRERAEMLMQVSTMAADTEESPREKIRKVAARRGKGERERGSEREGGKRGHEKRRERYQGKYVDP